MEMNTREKISKISARAEASGKTRYAIWTPDNGVPRSHDISC